MRTARLLPVSPSMHCSGGRTRSRGGTWSGLGVYLPGGRVPAQVSPPVNRMTNRCKNITLSQTSFAGGNNKTINLSPNTVDNLWF